VTSLIGLRDPDPVEAFMSARWWPMPNDLVGGWCVMAGPVPPSSGEPPVGDFLSEAVARHVADLHNAWLITRVGADRGT
jgi:hypothetical protein